MSKKSIAIKLYIFLLSFGGIYHAGMAQNISVEGTLFGRPFQANVDHELAKSMLTNRADSSVIQLFSDYRTHELNTETLSEITQRYSMDVATLFFAKRVYEQEKNKQLIDFYLTAVDTLPLEDPLSAFSFLQDYFIAFVPGFRYQHMDNGGDFLPQRRLLDSAGIPFEIINIEDVGLPSVNAQIVASRLQELNNIHSNIIVISVSKGGLETAIALGKLAPPDNLSSVKAWINVGGILKGSPIADHWGKPFMRFIMSNGLFWKRFWTSSDLRADVGGLTREMSYVNGVKKYNEWSIPNQIKTISLIAAPLAREKVNRLFSAPNDGFSYLPDAMTENCAVVMEMGLNHFFNDVDLNVRMAVLLRYIVNLVTNHE